jgi:penicillin-binding protein 1A
MDYAHQGVALKPIPGIADPFPAQKPMTVAAKKAAAEAAANAAPPPVRPRSLSAESTKVLRDLGEQLKDAPPVKGERMASVAP